MASEVTEAKMNTKVTEFLILKVNLRGLWGHRGQDEYQSNRVSDLVYKRQIFPLENRNLSLKNPMVWHQILLLKSLKKMWFAKIPDAI